MVSGPPSLCVIGAMEGSSFARFLVREWLAIRSLWRRMVGEHFMRVEGRSVRATGAHRRENVGMSNHESR